jgi:uncharacterized DUF497 family protein
VRLTWDEAKRKVNIAKHGVDFAAADAFEWRRAIVVDDRRRAYGERRRIALGVIGPSLYSLVYTRRAGAVRVISLRLASRKERKSYEDAKENRP